MEHKKENGTQKTRPLFCLRTPDGETAVRQSLSGRFLIGEDSIPRFVTETSVEPDLPYCEERGENNNRLVPLLEYLARESLRVQITGVALKDKGLYAVTSMTPVKEFMPGLVARTLTAQGMQACIRRLKTWNPGQPDVSADGDPPDLYQAADLEAFYAVCRHTLPPCISSAVQRNLSIANNGGAQNEREHAQKALRFLLNIDWSYRRLRVPDAEEAGKELDRLFFGMEPVKVRISEILATIRRTGRFPKWGILLNGPAGIGKTSIAKAIASLIRVPLIWLDLSSVGEAAEPISGSSRIYNNGQPGIIVSKMRENRSAAGILLVNELDKANTRSADNGCSSADVLLSILDKQGFRDNFLEELVPTDQLFAIATCNDISKVSKPLRDRFDRIDLPAYSPEEKAEIWKHYVLPRVLEQQIMKPDQMALTGDALEELVTHYAVDPGARDLEQYAERLAAVTGNYLDERGEDYAHTFDKEELTKLLGPKKTVVCRLADHPGEVNSFFYHDGAAHGFLLEASVVPGRGEFRALGPIGERQKEYIRVAFECVRNTLGMDFSKLDVTVFALSQVPDSTSNHVGCAAYAAICGLLRGSGLQPKDTAFIGGVDLNGNLYFDEPDIVPLLKTLKASGIQTLYSPLGVSEMIADYGADLCKNLTVIEAQNAKQLISLAVSA